ncbi:hypothetical protein [Lacrimispora sp.]|uniref:hypothetical protein n=1 Tax=Lacrimispora sp. TaxID=2719234 RepID=UPI0039948436
MADVLITEAIGIIADVMTTMTGKREKEELTGLVFVMVVTIQDAGGETTMTMIMTIAAVNNRKKAESLQEMETFRSEIWVS